MDSSIKERFSKPIVLSSNPVRDDLALLGPMLLAAGPLDPFHSLHYFQYIESSPNEEGDSFEMARHGNAIARWWAYQRLHPTDDNDYDDSVSEASWDNLSHSLENIASRVAPAPSVKCFKHHSDLCSTPLRSCLKGSTLTLPTDSTLSLNTPGDSPTTKRSGRRVMFNEVVQESIIADDPIIVVCHEQALGSAAADTNDGAGLGDDWVHIPAPSVLGLDLGPEKGNDPLPSLVAGASGNAQLTVKAIIPLEPVALYPPPQAEEVGVVVKFVPPTGMTLLTAEELLPSDRALRAAADAKLAEAINRLYARHDQGFMTGAVSAGGYRSAGGGGYLFDEGSWMIEEGRRGRGREPQVLLGDEVKPSVPVAGGQAGTIGLQDSVCAQAPTSTEMTLLKGWGNAKAGTGKGEMDSGDVGNASLVEHKASRGMLARMAGVTKGWIWRSG